MKRYAKINIQLLAAAGITFVAMLASRAIKEARPEAKAREFERPIPAVEVVPAQFGEVQLHVETQGTVVPEMETLLSAEVTGRILQRSPSFVAGGFFDAGELLVTIDPTDYQARLLEAEANLERAQATLVLEEAQAKQSRDDWQKMGRGEPGPLVLREPQLAQARANIKSAEAALLLARRNLERTEVRAPYAGRVEQVFADVGQIAIAGGQLARIYSTDFAEVRLPLTARQVGLIERLDKRTVPGAGEADRIAVELLVDYAGSTHRWEAWIDRMEGNVDRSSRLAYVVARVANPYEPGDERPPLKVGLFARAFIEGRTVNAVELPRWVLRSDGKLLVVNADNRLEMREVTVASSDAERIVITDGLQDGDAVSFTPMEAFSPGMRVATRPYEALVDAGEGTTR